MTDLLKEVQDEIETILEAIDGTPFGSGATARIFQPGEVLDLTAVPAASIAFGTDGADDIDNRRTLIIAQWSLQVWFDNGYSPPGDDNTRNRHATLLELVKNAFNADRTLNGKALDTRYTGGGNALAQQATEAEGGDLWTFTTQWETQYRHLTTDSSSQS